jgi:purine-binding chemotaxis protein CheW
MELFKKQEKNLGELLIEAKIITREQLEQALKEQKEIRAPLGKIIVKKGYAKEADIINALQGLLVIIFEINNELFAIEIVFTKEILPFKKITFVPAMPDYFLGMIAVREEVIPVISLNKKIFGKQDNIGEETKFLVIEVKEESIAIVVDRVLTVKNYQTTDFIDSSKYTMNEQKKYISGLIKDENKVISLIRPESLLIDIKK